MFASDPASVTPTPAGGASSGPDFSRLSADDLYLFNAGNHFRLYDRLGAHPGEVDGAQGTYFAVWAPNAGRVSVIGDFNDSDPDASPLRARGESGIWEGFVPGVLQGARYKYHLVSNQAGYTIDKTDPLGFRFEAPPRTASVVWDLSYAWRDDEWMRRRTGHNALNAPMSIYEIHLGSWRRVPEEKDRFLTYDELGDRLIEYVQKVGFTHVEFLPVMEHPFYGSWGYQVTGYFAPTGRYGTPQDFMRLIDRLHQHDIGVILDWVPSHFPGDAHGIGYFDGTHLYEHADPRRGVHPEWDSFLFNYGRHEVRSFLISNALFWLDRYHADGLRVDAVASMLYLDYARPAGNWVPNKFGGKENLEAIAFLRRLNEEVYKNYPGTQTIAEESTSWPMVSRPTYAGGLGFGLKWDMGWMHDTLDYFANDPIHRKYHHSRLTFRRMYAFAENFVLPLSHDEVVHGKASLLAKMPGDDWQKFANLRLLFGYMYAQPGKKLLFMGGEFGQWREWNHDASLDWDLLERPPHQGLQRWVADLNRVYRRTPALHALDCDPAGFAWVDCNDAENSVISLLRLGPTGAPPVLLVGNFTPVPRTNYRTGVPQGGAWHELLNSDARDYGGSGWGNLGALEAAPVSAHGRPFSLTLTLPPLAVLFLGPAGAAE
jgi:1,4-alpha-glucan branching enzyme